MLETITQRYISLLTLIFVTADEDGLDYLYNDSGRCIKPSRVISIGTFKIRVERENVRSKPWDLGTL